MIASITGFSETTPREPSSWMSALGVPSRTRRRTPVPVVPNPQTYLGIRHVRPMVRLMRIDTTPRACHALLIGLDEVASLNPQWPSEAL